jgi:hypothetical protein
MPKRTTKPDRFVMLIILLLSLKIGLGVLTRRAIFQGFFAFMHVTALAAHPFHFFIVFKNFIVFYVL